MCDQPVKAGSTGLVERIRQAVDTDRLIPEGCLVLAAVSGGADSLAMLNILHRLRAELTFELACIHVHHGLRGEAADADQNMVASVCGQLGIALHVRTADVAALARHRRTGLEQAARDIRREVFASLAGRLSRENGQQRLVRVALAHHRDDQAETVLMHLGRGSGLDGLTGMQALDGIYIRPLLAISRRDIRQWLSSQHIPWHEDATNQEGFTIRNRLRHEVLPAWQHALGYDPAPLLCRTASILASDKGCLDALATAAYAACVEKANGLSRSRLLEHHPALVSRMLRMQWHKVTGQSHDLAARHIELLLAWLPDAHSGGLDLPSGWRWVLVNDILVLRHSESPETSLQRPGWPGIQPEIPLAVPGKTCYPAGQGQFRAVEAEFVESADHFVYNGSVACFMAQQLAGCVLRTRRPGDVIHPTGRTGGKTLKKFLNEQRVPLPDRDRLLVLAVGREVIWLPGYVAGTGLLAGGTGCCGQIVRLTVQMACEGNAAGSGIL